MAVPQQTVTFVNEQFTFPAGYKDIYAYVRQLKSNVALMQATIAKLHGKTGKATEAKRADYVRMLTRDEATLARFAAAVARIEV